LGFPNSNSVVSDVLSTNLNLAKKATENSHPILNYGISMKLRGVPPNSIENLSLILTTEI
jgi:hypothetical protein